MQITEKTIWEIVCQTCWHKADVHKPTECRQIIEREYLQSGTMLLGFADKPDKRVYCDCLGMDPKRVKVSKVKEYE